MPNTIEDALGMMIFFAVMLSGFADILLAATWAKIYFTSGLLLFIRDIPIETHHSNIPSTSLLDNRLNSFWMGGFIFRELEANKYGFRRAFFSFAPRPILHGLVIFDAENKRVIVKGYLDWLMISFTILFFIIVPVAWLINGITFTAELLLFAVGFVAFFGLIFGILYLIDYYRLARIATVAVALWSRRYINSH